MRNGTSIYLKSVTLFFEEGECRNSEEAIFRYTEENHDGWASGDEIGYLETSVVLDEADQWFNRQSVAQNYTTYSAPDRKSFVSPQALKFADVVVIHQIRAFGQWLEGYPACRLNPDSDIDLSVVLVNPYERPALINIQFPDLQIKHRVRVPPGGAKRLSLSSCLNEEHFPWLGQVYVGGVNRIPCFMIHHSFANPYEIGKLEHMDPFRGEVQRLPFTRALHDRKRIGRI